MITLYHQINKRIMIRSLHPSSFFYKNVMSKCLSRHNSSSSPLTLVKESPDGTIRWITLNDVKKRNALSLKMIRSVNQSLDDTKDLRVIVINHSGHVFSAGHDLKELTPDTGSEYHKEVFDTCSDVMMRIQNHAVPVISMVDGTAAAAGCQLAVTCDITLATVTSKFSTPGASVGLFCSTPGIAVSRAANSKFSTLMLLTGDPVTATDALNAGLITKVLPDVDSMNAESEKIIQSICSKSKSVISLGKKFYYQQINMSLSDAYDAGSKVMVRNLCYRDAGIGIKSFIDKNKNVPKWTHETS